MSGCTGPGPRAHSTFPHTCTQASGTGDTAHFSAGPKWAPLPHGRKLPEDQDTSTPKPWSPCLEKEPKNSGGGSELVSVWNETSQGGWPLEHPMSLLCVLYVSCGMPREGPQPAAGLLKAREAPDQRPEAGRRW